MQIHKFRAKLLGYNNDFDIIWFDSKKYSKEYAESCFAEKSGITIKNNREFPYTYYEYKDKKYYTYKYLGVVEDTPTTGESFS